MANLDDGRCRALLGAARVGRLATVTDDGLPHVVPCCFALVGERLYSVVDGKPKSSTQLRRLDNIRANPGATLLVDHYDDDWTRLWWVRADGRARIIDPAAEPADPADRAEYDRAVDALAERYEPYRRQRPTGPLVVVEIERLSGWAFADPDAGIPVRPADDPPGDGAEGT